MQWHHGANNTLDYAVSPIKRSNSAPSSIHAIDLAAEPCAEIETRRTADLRANEVTVVTWNIAAPNNNPFEFWPLNANDAYTELMASVQQCFEHPEEYDSKMCTIFTQSMYDEFRYELQRHGEPNLEHLDHIWHSDLKNRMAITDFLKDPSFGDKRLISMPDRMTSSIRTIANKTAYRPSPITGIQEDISCVATWWPLWRSFMFHTEVKVRGETKRSPFALLEPIPRAKYPALSPGEEALSVPLQALCLALFDAALLRLLSRAAPASWQPLRRALHAARFQDKAATCVAILAAHYRAADVVFIQEASEAFAARAGVALPDHAVLRPAAADGRRAQLSLILVRRARFDPRAARDATAEALRRLPPGCAAAGDLCVFEAAARGGEPHLLASFHGDSDGATAAAALAAVAALAREGYPAHTLLFGLDANTADPGGPARAAAAAAGGGGGGLDGVEFRALLGARGLGSCWDGAGGDVWTACSARTHLQPQLHKAVGPAALRADPRRHRRLRDWVVFRARQLEVAEVALDNTGRGPGRLGPPAEPTAAFPSDHAVVSVTLRRAAAAAAVARRAATAPDLGVL